MKNFYLLFSILLCCMALPTFATITFTQPAAAVDGQPQTIHVQGETPGMHLDGGAIQSSYMFVVNSGTESAIPEYYTLINFSVTAYNCAGNGTGTSITFTLHRVVDPDDPSIATVQLPVQLHFTAGLYNCSGAPEGAATAYVASFTSYPAGHTTFTSAAITESLTRSTCSAPSTGVPFNYTLAAGHNTSGTSQADADAQALTYYNANKATWANTGSCTPVMGNPFPVINNSLNSLSITFQKTDGTLPNNIGAVVAPGTTYTFTIPASNYNIIISPGGMPVNCTMTFSNGLSWPNAPGHTFMGVNVGSGSGTNPANSLTATRP